MWEIVLRILAALGGLGFLGTTIVAIMQRRKVKAEADKTGADAAQVLTSTAIAMLTTVQQDLTACRLELSALRGHVSTLEASLRANGLPVPEFVYPVLHNGHREPR